MPSLTPSVCVCDVRHEIFGGYSFFRSDVLRYHVEDVAKARGMKLSAAEKEAYRRRLQEGSLMWGAEGSRWLRDEAEQVRKDSDQLLGYTPAMLSSIPFIHSAAWFAQPLRDKYASLHPLYYHLTSSPSFDQRFIQRLREGAISRLNGSLYLECKTMLPNILLKSPHHTHAAQFRLPGHQLDAHSRSLLRVACGRWLGDSEEMAHSVEGRTPFLDHPLVDYVNRLPLDLKIRLASSPDHHLQLSEKHLLKRAAAPFLPDSIVRKEKHPFLAPPTLLTPHSLMYHCIRDTVRGKEMEEMRGVVDVDRVRHALDAIDREVAEGRKATLNLQELLRLEQWLLMICSLNTSHHTSMHADSSRRRWTRH